ncbi:MAG: hypothetical protein IPK20_25980 [Betaproteobacteria bacterium]|nr:hypothetical protein [Betaproteobacteria bacterium]
MDNAIVTACATVNAVTSEEFAAAPGQHHQSDNEQHVIESGEDVLDAQRDEPWIDL